ncbi:MAG: hypothetical protein HRU36_02535 [Rickettsiales bacterium]|nr:hypothetical protein [Rickettsiales bacterium]
MLKKIAFTLMPIHKDEIQKCISMGMMFFFILFNYDFLRPLKDSLIVTNIGPEATNFVKMYAVTPAALLVVIIYTYLSERLKFETIFYYFGLVFLLFFLCFGFILHPNQEFFTANASTIEKLVQSDLNLFFFTINLDHFKWFLKIYGKWPFALYYVMAEIWGSIMIFLLFWQFANLTTKTSEAKRLYPAYSFIGHIGAFTSGLAVTFLTSKINKEYFIQNSMIIASFMTIMTMIMLRYNIIKARRHYVKNIVAKKAEELKPKLTVIESFKIILSSKYLLLIVIAIMSYGTCLNLFEGVWRMRTGQLYTDTVSYSRFMGQITTYVGLGAMICLFLGGFVLRTFGWLFGTMILPVSMAIVGTLFFLFSFFGDYITPYANQYGLDIFFMTVMVGGLQYGLTKTFKYSFFDITKEMSFIPAEPHLRSKGKAAVDVIGARWSRSIGALIQSGAFIIFPFATYQTLTPYLMVVYVIIITIWIFNVKKLSVAYAKKVEQHEHAH